MSSTCPLLCRYPSAHKVASLSPATPAASCRQACLLHTLSLPPHRLSATDVTFLKLSISLPRLGVSGGSPPLRMESNVRAGAALRFLHVIFLVPHTVPPSPPGRSHTAFPGGKYLHKPGGCHSNVVEHSRGRGTQLLTWTLISLGWLLCGQVHLMPDLTSPPHIFSSLAPLSSPIDLPDFQIALAPWG